MKSYKSLLLSAVITAFVFPVTSYAQDASGMKGKMDHGGEVGVIDHTIPKSTKTRANVMSELYAAHMGGTHDMGNNASTVRPAPATAGKSRGQVQMELSTMSRQEKETLKEIYVGAM